MLILAFAIAQLSAADPVRGPSAADVLNSEIAEFDGYASEAFAEGASVDFGQRPRRIDKLKCVRRTEAVRDCRYNVRFLRGRFLSSRPAKRAFERSGSGWRFLYETAGLPKR